MLREILLTLLVAVAVVEAFDQDRHSSARSAFPLTWALVLRSLELAVLPTREEVRPPYRVRASRLLLLRVEDVDLVVTTLEVELLQFLEVPVVVAVHKLHHCLQAQEIWVASHLQKEIQAVQDFLIRPIQPFKVAVAVEAHQELV